MPIAALPKYLVDKDLSTASPGLRFGMYLRLWGVDARSRARLWTTHDINYRPAGRDQQVREFKDENKTACLKEACRLGRSDQDLLNALASRQLALGGVAQNDNLLILDAQSTAPFTTGLGNEHPLENGFAFLNPYGLPYLPGSGVKGVLRQAARELASGEWGDTSGWDAEACFALMTGPDGHRKAVLDNNRQAVILNLLDVLFGRETSNGEGTHVRGVLSFWDVIPQIPGDHLAVDIMTPHQSHYYQKKPQAGSVTPHESGQPNPISFLTVPPGARFVFHVQCDLAHLRRLAPELAEKERWRTLLESAFKHAFQWLGFGAKTAVGYGAMQENPAVAAARQAERERIKARLQVEQAAQARAALPYAERLLAELDLQLNGLPRDPRNDAPLLQQTSIPKWTELLEWLSTEVVAMEHLSGSERADLAAAVKRRLLSHFKVEGKAEKAMKQVLVSVRGG